MSDTATMESVENMKSAPATGKDSAQAFSFRRMSGMDQIVLKNDYEWQHLDELDPKLWMALSCPVDGLEFDADTLALLDSDHDGRIRDDEVKEAVNWVCQRIREPASLAKGGSTINADDLREDTPEGSALASALKIVMDHAGGDDAKGATLEEINAAVAEAANYPFNGDGIIPPDSAPDTPLGSGLDLSVRQFVDTALTIVGAMRDASGKPGLNATLGDEFTKRLNDVLTWRQSLQKAHLPLGEKTGEAWTLLVTLGPKLDDYFHRCKLAAYDPNTLTLSTVPDTGEGLAALLDRQTLQALPLAKISEKAVLDFSGALNPAWDDELASFRKIISQLPSGNGKLPASISEAEWKTIKNHFDEYAAILEKKPSFSAASPDAERIERAGFPTLALARADDPLNRAFEPLDPNGAIAALSDSQITNLLNSEAQKAFADLVAKDEAAPPLASFQDLRKLALYKANLYTFLMNFLSFVDFYEPDKKAIFQAGVLFLDSRACLLCVPVDDLENHARLAAQSHLCLIYCACSRKGADGAEQHATIAAALTLGNLASLIEGRHGLFVDNHGQEWDTSIIRIVHNPISLREAMWAPYIRMSNMVSEQLQKFVAAKEAAINDLTGKTATSLVSGTPQPAPAPAAAPASAKEGFDFAKGAGIFAAVSVAVSVLSAAFAYIAHSLVSLGWWWPLAVVALFVCISGPSMLMAWFKLRRRNLGSLLDASGWAVNKGAPINLVMGGALTTVAKLPHNAIKDLNDPYSLPARMRSRKRKAIFWIIFLLLLIIALGAFILYCWLFVEPVWVTKLRLFLGI